MPTPKDGESHDDFVERCIPFVLDDGTAKTQKQAVAVCESMWRQRERGATMTQVQRRVVLRGALDTAEVRVATYQDREHLVVPVVMLVGNVVVRPLGSKGPEFVPAEELARAPKGWNGRPVVPDHPDEGRASANEPRTLERQSFGQVFHAEYTDGKLKAEAYLDPARAAAVGRDAERVIERVRAKEPVEVSVGAWITAEEVAGEYNGVSYEVRWTDIVPDHLAMLPEGATGACSVDMGCGAPRANAETPTAQLRAADNDERPRRTKMLTWLTEQLRGLVGLRLAAEDEGASDVSLRESLDALLRASVAGYQGIVEVFPDSRTVIYATAPDDKFLFWRDAYNGDGQSLELAGAPEEVAPVTRYEPVAAQLADDGETTTHTAATDGGCACGVQPHADQGETHMSQIVKDLVGALISNELTPFTEADAAALEHFDEERLQALSDEYAEAPADAATDDAVDDDDDAGAGVVQQHDDQPADTVQLSRDEYDDVIAAARCWKQQQAKHKEALVQTLATAQRVYDRTELTAMSVDQLEKVARLVEADLPSYTGRVVAKADARGASEPPDGWNVNGANSKEAN